MNTLKSLFVSLLAMGVAACSGSENNSYNGPAPLSPGQKAETASAVESYNSFSASLDSVVNEEDPKENDPVDELLRNCEVTWEGGGDVNKGEATTRLIGEDCPVNYQKTVTWETVEIEGEEYTELLTDVNYSTENTQLILLTGIESLSMQFQLPAAGYPSSDVEIGTPLGTVRISDRLDVEVFGTDPENMTIRFTYFRKINMPGFVVEARAIADLKPTSDGEDLELIRLQLIVNGQNVSQEEFMRLFPDVFQDLGLN